MPPGSADEISGDGNMFSSLCVTNVQYATLISMNHLMHISVMTFIQFFILKSSLLWTLANKYCTVQAVQLTLAAQLEWEKEKLISDTQGWDTACVCNETSGMLQRRVRGLQECPFSLILSQIGFGQ